MPVSLLPDIAVPKLPFRCRENSSAREVGEYSRYTGCATIIIAGGGLREIKVRLVTVQVLSAWSSSLVSIYGFGVYRGQ